MADDIELLQQAVDAVAEYGTQAEAARQLNWSRQTLISRLDKARRDGISARAPIGQSGPVLTQPNLPTGKMTDEELWSRLEDHWNLHSEAVNARRWYEVQVNSNEPMGICWFGDPHLDDNGCNIPLLRQHIRIVAETPGMVGANIGDTHNNWVGRLAAIYENQRTTRREAIQLIESFLMRSGIEWLLVLAGNHDEWRGGLELLGAITKNVVPLHDWQAQIKLRFPNGRELPIWAAHDFKGNSQWNPLHGPMKMAAFSGLASLYVCGHKHNWALYHSEDPHRGGAFWACRAQGYKHHDSYAEKLMFGSQSDGASIVSVIDPAATSESRVLTCFADVAEGAEYLTWKRRKAGVSE